MFEITNIFYTKINDMEIKLFNYSIVIYNNSTNKEPLLVGGSVMTESASHPFETQSVEKYIPTTKTKTIYEYEEKDKNPKIESLCDALITFFPYDIPDVLHQQVNSIILGDFLQKKLSQDSHTLYKNNKSKYLMLKNPSF